MYKEVRRLRIQPPKSDEQHQRNGAPCVPARRRQIDEWLHTVRTADLWPDCNSYVASKTYGFPHSDSVAPPSAEASAKTSAQTTAQNELRRLPGCKCASSRWFGTRKNFPSRPTDRIHGGAGWSAGVRSIASAQPATLRSAAAGCICPGYAGRFPVRVPRRCGGRYGPKYLQLEGAPWESRLPPAAGA